MTEIAIYQRLERTITLIARHPFYPGKQEALDHCLEDLEERFRAGSLTHDEKSKLAALLLSDAPMGGAGTERGSGVGHAR